jgi:MYXO-CTERM domain-containing protein
MRKFLQGIADADPMVVGILIVVLGVLAVAFVLRRRRGGRERVQGGR